MDALLSQTLDLVRRAKAGSTTALRAVSARYFDRVARIVRVRVGHELRAQLETGDIGDLLEETFRSVVRSFDRFDLCDESEFLHWLSAAVENEIRRAAELPGVMERCASRERGRESSMDGDGDRPADETSPDRLQPDAAARAERTALVERCLDRLSEADREVILQRDYMGASWVAIARATGRPSPDAARMKHAHAIIELARRVRRAEGT